MKRIAPNNQLPATHFMEIFYNEKRERIIDDFPIKYGDVQTVECLSKLKNPPDLIPVVIFRIRENKLPTKHKF